MEEEKKKKKNKKKKGKQTNTSADVAVSVGETAALEQNHCMQNSGTTDRQIAGVLESVKLDGHQTDGVKGVMLDEAEKQLWLQREKLLEEEIKQVLLDKRSWTWKEASLEERIKQLQIEKDSCIQREASLEERIKQLQFEKDSGIQREVGLEKKIINLQSEKNSWLQKEASMEEKIKQLLNEKAVWISKVNSTKEMITRLNEDNMVLQMQVKELEESRTCLLQENQQLIEATSVMRSQMQQLERKSPFSATAETEKVQHVSKDEDSLVQMEAARALVQKLITENGELVEKVNELYVELDRQSVTAGHSSTAAFEPAGDTEPAIVPDYMPDISDKMSESGERMESKASIQTEDKRISVDYADTESTTVAGFQIEESPGSYKAGEIEEIVQIPLDDIEIQEVESQAVETDGNVGVPLTDAPLIGAPFRLISFVAKYVSGADLVNNTLNSGR